MILPVEETDRNARRRRILLAPLAILLLAASCDSESTGLNQENGDTDPPDPSEVFAECAEPADSWIWCDDFQEDRMGSYFEYDAAGGNFIRTEGVGVGGGTGMRARWTPGAMSVGFLHLAFGRTPQAYFQPVDDGTDDYREIYWRLYLRNADEWTGGGADKLSRATIFAATDSWAQAMIAHVWSGSGDLAERLLIDPASGTDPEGNLQTTTYNDFDNLRWLGLVASDRTLFVGEDLGRWHCIEARVRLNAPGADDGVFQLWINGELEASRTDLNWVGAYDEYGINAVFVENFWNAGSPAEQERYLDHFVVSTERIGCLDGTG